MYKTILQLGFLVFISCNSSKASIEKKYYDTGELKLEIHKLKKQFHGITNEYSKDGKLKYIWNYKLDKLEGETTEYHLDRTKSIWLYDKDTLLSRKTYTKDNKLYQTFNYLNGLRHGNAYQFYNSGEIEVMWVFEKDKVTEGYAYYKTGELKNEFKYQNGMADGISLEYYQNGGIKYEWNYKKDELNGITKEFYRNGKIKHEWNYKNNTLDGKSISYDSASNIINYSYYDYGKFIIQIKPY